MGVSGAETYVVLFYQIGKFLKLQILHVLKRRRICTFSGLCGLSFVVYNCFAISAGPPVDGRRSRYYDLTVLYG